MKVPDYSSSGAWKNGTSLLEQVLPSLPWALLHRNWYSYAKPAQGGVHTLCSTYPLTPCKELGEGWAGQHRMVQRRVEMERQSRGQMLTPATSILPLEVPQSGSKSCISRQGRIAPRTDTADHGYQAAFQGPPAPHKPWWRVC